LLKIFFCRTSRPISIKLGINHPWVKGTQSCANQGPGPFQRGDNHKNPKKGWSYLKIFSGATGPILTRLGAKHPRAKGIQNCTNEGQPPFPRGDDSERVNILNCSNKGPDHLQRGDNLKNAKMG
jgi:hypothetical protein